MTEINGREPPSVQIADAARKAAENVWKGERPHTSLPAAGQVAPAGEGRAEFFQRLRVPMENGTGKPEKMRDADRR